MVGWLFGLLMTPIVYWLCKAAYQRRPIVILSPMITSVVILILALLALHIPYSKYIAGAHIYTWLLKPATVGFAIPLHKHYPVLKKYSVEILSSIASGSVIAITSSVLLATALGFTRTIQLSLAPRSVTTPIAMAISRELGGIPVLTAVFVIMTGIIGMVIGPSLIRMLHIRSAIAKGTLMGMGAHGIGTAKAFELGAVEGTISSLSLIVAGIFTVILAPILVSLGL